MTEQRRVVDGRGRTWTVRKVRKEAAEEAAFRFWYEELPPEEQVEPVNVSNAELELTVAYVRGDVARKVRFR